MFGNIAFWLLYVIAIVLLYTILTGHIDKHGNRVKHPLWLIIFFCIMFFIPVANIGLYALYMLFCTNSKDNFKSFLTKKY